MDSEATQAWFSWSGSVLEVVYHLSFSTSIHTCTPKVHGILLTTHSTIHKFAKRTTAQREDVIAVIMQCCLSRKRFCYPNVPTTTPWGAYYLVLALSDNLSMNVCDR